MAYTDYTKLKNRMPDKDIIELTDDAALGTVNNTVLDAVIADAESEINGKLRGRYTAPISPVPAAIEWIAAVLTMNRLYSRNHRLILSDGIAREVKSARLALDELQSGKQILEGFEGSGEGHPGFIAVNKEAGDRVFNEDLLAQY